MLHPAAMFLPRAIHNIYAPSRYTSLMESDATVPSHCAAGTGIDLSTQCSMGGSRRLPGAQRSTLGREVAGYGKDILYMLLRRSGGTVVSVQLSRNKKAKIKGKYILALQRHRYSGFQIHRVDTNLITPASLCLHDTGSASEIDHKHLCGTRKQAHIVPTARNIIRWVSVMYFTSILYTKTRAR